MHKKSTSGTIARDIMNILREDSLLRKTTKQRQVIATKAAIEWRKQNPKKASEKAVSGGNGCLNKGVGIHAESFEVRSERAKKNYKEGKGMAKLTKEDRSKIGKTKGKANLVATIICEKCGRTTNKGNYAQSHGQNCRELDKIQLIDLLPDTFTTSEMKKIANDNDIDWMRLNILHHTCIYVSIKEKGKFPFQMNPNIYSKNKKEMNKVKKYLNK